MIDLKQLETKLDSILAKETPDSLKEWYRLYKLEHSPLINCLAYALRFWEKYPYYKIYYNNDHVINSRKPVPEDIFTPLESYHYEGIKRLFTNLLDDYEQLLLKKYFNVV